MTDEEEWVTRQLWYRGRFLGPKNKLWYVFVAKDSGAEHCYSAAMPHPTIGALYDVEMNATKARIQYGSMSGSMMGSLHPDAEAWRLEDQAAALAKQGADAAKRMASHNDDFGDLTLNQIKDMIAKQPRHVQNGTRLIVMEYLR